MATPQSYRAKQEASVDIDGTRFLFKRANLLQALLAHSLEPAARKRYMALKAQGKLDEPDSAAAIAADARRDAEDLTYMLLCAACVEPGLTLSQAEADSSDKWYVYDLAIEDVTRCTDALLPLMEVNKAQLARLVPFSESADADADSGEVAHKAELSIAESASIAA